MSITPAQLQNIYDRLEAVATPRMAGVLMDFGSLIAGGNSAPREVGGPCIPPATSPNHFVVRVDEDGNVEVIVNVPSGRLVLRDYEAVHKAVEDGDWWSDYEVNDADKDVDENGQTEAQWAQAHGYSYNQDEDEYYRETVYGEGGPEVAIVTWDDQNGDGLLYEWGIHALPGTTLVLERWTDDEPDLPDFTDVDILRDNQHRTLREILEDENYAIHDDGLYTRTCYVR